MNWQSLWQLAKSDYMKLVPILALAFYMAFIPHLTYPYPVHIDEWVHIAHSNALLQAADTNHPDPFSGQPTSGLVAVLEAGYHLLFGVFHQISGISWLTIFRYFPSIVFMMTVLSVYILAQREGFGWEAAFFTCLIPTTVGIMGPAFLVPVAMGLLFVPLTLFIVLNFRTVWSYLVFFIFIAFLTIMHAPSAICVVLVIVPVILLNLKGDFKHSLGLTLALAIPLLLTLPLTASLIVDTAKSLFVPQPLPEYHDLPRIIETYGYLPAGLGLLGTFWLVMKGGVKNYSLVLGLLALLLMLAVFYTFHYGVDMMYLRGILFMMLMLSIVAGAGLMMIKNLKLPAKLGLPTILLKIGYPLCLALVIVTLVIGIPDRQDSRYYHMIDSEDYEAFVWIRDNVGEGYEKAILDPWKATAFTAITEKHVYTRIHVAPVAKDKEAYAFLANGSIDTAFLRKYGISVIYTRVYEGAQNRSIEYDSDNPDLVEVRRHVYILKESEK